MYQMIVSDLEVDVVRKDIKNLHLAVYPPDGRVRVAVPLHIDDDAVRLAVISKIPWIKKQRTKFVQQERQTKRQYISGESHYFQGRRYLLDVVYTDEMLPGIRIRNKKKIELTVRPDTEARKRGDMIIRWYRQYLKGEIPPLIDKWETLIGVQVNEWRVRQMKTKWGSCNIEEGRIWLNLELAKKPVECLEYIIVHEMVHLLERHHNDRFTDYMNQFLPNWRIIRDELNREPLAYGEWDY